MELLSPSMSSTAAGHSKLTLLELAVLTLYFLGQQQAVDAHILVYRSVTSQLIEEYNDLPAQFGPSLPPNGLRVFAIPGVPEYGCTKMDPPPASDYPNNAKFVALIQRGGKNCTFELKVRNAQAASFNAVIVYNNNGDDLEQMSAQNSTGIVIPSVFVGHTTGMNLRSFFTPEVVLVINDELPFNINTQLILPFSILIAFCFLVMIFYMIYKCIREQRRLRRFRLPKRMLKKLPILKYTKNNDLSYDTCVICLDDFVEGDKLRVLPCRHPYHSHCIDPWLTENRRVCPICKRKVFTKGEARSNRNRQSSLDSVTDTDDDTTPLLQQSAGSAAAHIAGDADAASATRHGTFRRGGDTAASPAVAAIAATDGASDDENVLLTHQSPSRNAGRVNPFDRAPNLPSHLAEHLNENRRSIWSYPIFRLFRRPQSISVAAPPFLEEGLQPGDDIHASVGLPAASLPLGAAHSSNNILNPNLSGSFKDDDDEEQLPQRSIYEPIAVTTPTSVVAGANSSAALVAADGDTQFVQTPAQGGIGVVALPNTNIRGGGGRNGQRQFLI